MDTVGTRRKFLAQCAQLGGACCALLAWNGRLSAAERVGPGWREGQGTTLVDLKRLSYCGIPCTSGQVCELYRLTTDLKMKQEYYEKRPKDMNALFGIDRFDPDKMFCHTCKPGDKPLTSWQMQCPARRCARANAVESCIQCSNLAACDQPGWKTMPHHYAYAKWTQARYVQQPGSVLVAGKKVQ